MINLYSLLQISSYATKEEIKNAYYTRKSMTNDRNTLWLIEEAYNVLMDDSKRLEYDILILGSELDKKQNIIQNNQFMTINNQDKVPK